MNIHRLLYRSEANLDGSDASIQQQISEIVARAAIKNEAKGLTGALFYAGGIFVQALEGDLPTIEETFERICCDHRHRRLDLLELVNAESRMFAEWSMARVTADRRIARLVTGTSSFDERPVDEAMSAQATAVLLRSLLVADLEDGAYARPMCPVERATSPMRGMSISRR